MNVYSEYLPVFVAILLTPILMMGLDWFNRRFSVYLRAFLIAREERKLGRGPSVHIPADENGVGDHYIGDGPVPAFTTDAHTVYLRRTGGVIIRKIDTPKEN